MSKQHPTIMVVEDEALLLQAITKKLKLSNLDVVSCAGGQQAIDYLNGMDELPDAVWLDYYLKDMNGLAFMQALKENPKWSNIPVLVVSNSASPEKVTNMLGLGVRKYILKAEYRLDEIIQMILDFIGEDGTGPEVNAAAGAAPTAAPSTDQTAATTPPAIPTTPDDTVSPANPESPQAPPMQSPPAAV